MRTETFSCPMDFLHQGVFNNNWILRYFRFYDDGGIEIFKEPYSKTSENFTNSRDILPYLVYGDMIGPNHMRIMPQHTNPKLLIGFPLDMKNRHKLSWILCNNTNQYNKVLALIKGYTPPDPLYLPTAEANSPQRKFFDSATYSAPPPSYSSINTKSLTSERLKSPAPLMMSSNTISEGPSSELKTSASPYYPYSYERHYYQPYGYWDWYDNDWYDRYYDRYYTPRYTYWDDWRRDYYFDPLWDRYSYRPATTRRFKYTDDYDWDL